MSLISIHEVGIDKNCLLSKDYRSLYIALWLNGFLHPGSDADILTFKHMHIPPSTITTVVQYKGYC